MSRRRRRLDRLAAPTVAEAHAIEDRALRAVRRRNLARRIVDHGGDVDVPEVTPEAEAAAERARHRRPPPTPDQVEAMKARITAWADEHRARA